MFNRKCSTPSLQKVNQVFICLFLLLQKHSYAQSLGKSVCQHHGILLSCFPAGTVIQGLGLLGEEMQCALNYMDSQGNVRKSDNVPCPVDGFEGTQPCPWPGSSCVFPYASPFLAQDLLKKPSCFYWTPSLHSAAS